MPPLPQGNEVLLRFLLGVIMLVILVPKYSAIARSWAITLYMPNNNKVQISNGQYFNLAKLEHNFSNTDDETQ